MHKIILAAIVSTAITGTAFAQEADFAAKMREVNAATPQPHPRALQADSLKSARAYATQKGRCVPTSLKLGKPTPVTADRGAIQGVLAGELKNMWLVYGQPAGCADSVKTRFVVMQTADGTLYSRVLNQGDSLTTPALMRDTAQTAVAAAAVAIQKADPNCKLKGIDLDSSKVGTQSRDLSPDFYGARYKGSWSEIWTFSDCGIRAAVPVYFTADGSGGAYTSAKPNEVTVTRR